MEDRGKLTELLYPFPGSRKRGLVTVCISVPTTVVFIILFANAVASFNILGALASFIVLGFLASQMGWGGAMAYVRSKK